MSWAGASEFAAAPRADWVVDGKVTGESRAAKGLTFLRVYNAGHMVPMDQPVAALSMLQTFVDNKPFSATNKLPLTAVVPVAPKAGVWGALAAVWAWANK